MSVSRAGTQLEQALRGARIVEVYEQKAGSSGAVMIKLDNGKTVTISQEGSPGPHYEWADYLVIRINGEVVFKG